MPPAGVKTKGQVAFFPGCAFEFFFADMGESIASVLAQAGYEVVLCERPFLLRVGGAQRRRREDGETDGTA